MRRKNNSGFSEIELVTFVVLVAVIVILVRSCQDRMHSNDIQSNIVQLTKYRSVIEQFKYKYGQLPGDYTQANKTWPDCPDSPPELPQPSAKCNGNGDGYWDIFERSFVFDHLSRAEMIDEKYYAIANSKLDQKIFPEIPSTGQSIVPIGLLSADDRNTVSGAFFNYTLPQNSFMIYFESNVPGDSIIPTQKKVEGTFAIQTDIKLDDGKGGSGNMRAGYDRTSLFGPHDHSEDCTDAQGNYKDDEDNYYYCSFIMKY